MPPSRVDERTALTVQGGYYVVTGVAPFVSRRAFEAVTGPKREWWLVQTVGAVVTAVGAALLSGAHSGRITPELRGLAAGCAASLAAIDTVYVARRRIAPTYLLDAVAQLAVLVAMHYRRDSGASCPDRRCLSTRLSAGRA
jgi:hypothetical protein